MNNQSLAEWLESLDCYDVYPIQVKIGKIIYTGCHYKQDREYNFKPYTNECLYLLGSLPSSYVNRHAKRYLYNGIYYYIAGYIENIPDDKKEYHPFGKNFLMMINTILENDKVMNIQIERK